MGNQEYGPPPSGEPIWTGAQPPVRAQDPMPPSAYPPGSLPVSASPAAYPPPYPPAYPAAYPQPYPQVYPAAYPPAYPHAYPPQLGATGTDKNWMGTASLVLSLVGMWLLGLIFGILGINAAKNGRANNRAMSIWGVSISVVSVIVMVSVAAIFGLGNGSLFGDRVPYSELAVGDCIQKPPGWDDGGSANRVVDVTRVSCAKHHWGQVYYLDVLSGASYPGDDAVKTEVKDLCYSDAAAANIMPEHVDQVMVSYIMPTADSWLADNRHVICFASDEQRTLTESWVVEPRVTKA